MKTLLCTFAVLFGAATTANADAYFVNATSTEYTVEATFPNKKVQTRKLSPLSSNLAREYFLLAPGIEKLAIEIKDDTGAVAWKGTTGKDDMMLIAPAAKGIQVVYAGIYGGSEATRAELFMNVTGEELTLDLFGGNGVASSLGVKPPLVFDAKKLVKLDPREASYEVKGKKKDGTEVEIEGKVSGFRYCVIWKTDSGGYRAWELGHIPPPAKKGKK